MTLEKKTETEDTTKSAAEASVDGTPKGEYPDTDLSTPPKEEGKQKDEEPKKEEESGKDAAVAAVTKALEQIKDEDDPEAGSAEDEEPKDQPKGDDDKKDEDDKPKDEPISPELMNRAQALGFSPEEIANFKNEEDLGVALDLFTQRLAAIPPPPTGDAGGEGAGDQDDDEGKDEENTFEFDWTDPDDPDRSEDDLDEVVLRNLNGMKEHFAGRIKQLEEQLGNALSYVETQRREQQTAEIDRMFDGVDESLQSLVGKGPLADLPQDSPESKNRVNVVQTMVALHNGFAANGLAIPPKKELFKMALNATLGEQMGAALRKSMAQDVAKRKKQHIQRPTRRRTAATATGIDKAVDAVKAQMSDMGLLEE